MTWTPENHSHRPALGDVTKGSRAVVAKNDFFESVCNCASKLKLIVHIGVSQLGGHEPKEGRGLVLIGSQHFFF